MFMRHCHCSRNNQSLIAVTLLFLLCAIQSLVTKQHLRTTPFSAGMPILE